VTTFLKTIKIQTTKVAILRILQTSCLDRPQILKPEKCLSILIKTNRTPVPKIAQRNTSVSQKKEKIWSKISSLTISRMPSQAINLTIKTNFKTKPAVKSLSLALAQSKSRK